MYKLHHSCSVKHIKLLKIAQYLISKSLLGRAVDCYTKL
jgi:hypothetical protein